MNAMESKADDFIRNLGILAIGWRHRATGRLRSIVRHPERKDWSKAMRKALGSAVKIGILADEPTRTTVKPWVTFYTMPSPEGDWTVAIATEYAHPIGKSVRRELRRMARLAEA